ncbi:MAG: hypothetical protein AAGC60_20035 [Acidobacteriota bacterium]
MPQTQTPEITDTAALEALVAQLQTEFDAVAADVGGDASPGYEPAAISASLSVGPAGSGMQGWITYDRPGRNKIYFRKIAEHSRSGLFAGGGPGVTGVLEPDFLEGKRGTFRADGFGTAGVLQLWCEGKPVFFTRLVLAGAGLGPWHVEGEVAFERP